MGSLSSLWPLIVKIGLTSVVIVAISEIARRSTFWAAALASLPLTSLLAFVWIYLESGRGEPVAELSRSIFWLVLPSLPLFLLLPALLRAGLNFWLALGLSCVATALAYAGMVWGLERIGVKL